MTKDKMFSIISISCFVSVLFIPIGLALMWLYTNWKKLWKLIISVVLTALYVGLIVFLLKFEPSDYSDDSINLPVKTEQSNSQVDSKGNLPEEFPEIDNSGSNKKGQSSKKDSKPDKMPSSLKKSSGMVNSRLIFSILFFLFMLFLVIWQNLKKGKTVVYENPYVDVSKYKLPFTDDSKMPLVHFLKLRLNPTEQIYFASTTTQKNNEGDFVITSQRVVLYTPTETIEFPLHVLTAVTSVTDTVMQLVSGDKKYIIFLPESQMKYALAVLRWSAKKDQEKVNEN